MANDDLSSWLKVAAENKITTKNTWKSTLIEHFTDIKQFKEQQGINFLKASCTLEGCVKVYSTRVDDVSEEAMKLLEGFSIDDSKKKYAKKKGAKTIETNLSNINIKNNTNKIFRDSTFLSINAKPENILLLSVLCISKDGVFRMYKEEVDRDIKMCMIEPDRFNIKDKLICPIINKYEEIKNMVPENNFEEEVDVQFEEVEEMNDYAIEDEMPMPVFKETAFSYFKGWSGPTHWKIIKKASAKQNIRKLKDKYFLDFMEEININLIFEKADTLIEPSTISKRKETSYNLPENYNLEEEDLYKYNVLDKQINKVVQDVVDLSFLNEPNEIIEEPIDEIVIDNKMSKDLLPYRREQKKVDIKKLKSNIMNNLKDKKGSKLSDICKEVPEMYDEKEKKDISIHFCIVSLLHVANEKNLELEVKDDDVIIKT